MPKDFFEATTRSLAEDHYKLLSLEIKVPDPDEATRRRTEYGPFAVRATIVATWEPLSYELQGEYGNVETDYFDLTTGRDGLSDDECQAIRDNGFHGIPVKKLINQPNDEVDPKRIPDRTQRWYHAAKAAGLRLSIDDTTGQFVSPDIGATFRCAYGGDSFPKWDRVNKRHDYANTRFQFSRYPLAKVEGFVIPEDRPVRIIEKKAEAVSAVAASAPSGPTDQQIADALVTVGIVGSSVDDLGNVGMLLSTLSKGAAQGLTALQDKDLGEAAANGDFVSYITEKGFVEVDNEGIVQRKVS